MNKVFIRDTLYIHTVNNLSNLFSVVDAVVGVVVVVVVVVVDFLFSSSGETVKWHRVYNFGRNCFVLLCCCCCCCCLISLDLVLTPHSVA